MGNLVSKLTQDEHGVAFTQLLKSMYPDAWNYEDSCNILGTLEHFS